MLKSPLVKVAVVGGVFVIGATTWMESRMQSNFRQQEFYQKPIQMLHKYQPAEEFLGRPIYGGRLNLGEADNFKVNGLSADLSIPLKGPKGKGIMHVHSSREKRDDSWNIDQLELEISSTKQRWKFYDRSLISESTPDSSPSSTPILTKS